MDSTVNPYTPGSGLQPAELVGRDKEIDDFDRIVARTKLRYAERGMVLSGLRGVGKTVLLRRLESHAQNQGWMTVFIEGQPNEGGQVATRRRLARMVASGARSYAHRARARRFLKTIADVVTSFSVGAGQAGVTASVGIDASRAATGDLDMDLEELVEDITNALAEQSAAFALFVDEMQDLDRDLLGALVTTQHLAGQRGWPFLIFGAGLPNLPSVLSESRSYAERLFDYRTIGPIDETAAYDALTIPAQRCGGTYDHDAAAFIVNESAGYPYFLQQFGRATWDLAPGLRSITLEDARAGVEVGYLELDAGFFPSRWDRATAAERRYLTAMAATGVEAPRASDLVRELGARTASDISATRAELIAKGLIYAPQHGRIAFTVPGMANYIRRVDTA